MYETNNGGVRVGYVNGNKVRGGVPLETSLHFDHEAAMVRRDCTLTDDPAARGTAIASLRAGMQVTWLTRYYNQSAWDYVEVSVQGKAARGFVPAGSLSINHGSDPLESLSFGR